MKMAGTYTIRRLLLIIFMATALVLPQQGSAGPAWFKSLAIPSEMQQSPLHCIYQDNTGLIWIGTGSAVFSYNGNQYKRLEVPDNFSESGVTALYEDSENLLWVGCEDGSVWHFDRSGNFTFILPSNEGIRSRITSFVEDPAGNMWIGTYGSGALVKNDTGMVAFNTGNGLSDNYIYSMVADGSGRIWMGTDNGINIFDPSDSLLTLKHLSIEDGLPDFIVQSITVDADGNIWAGFYDKGICKYDLETESFILPSGLLDWHYGAVSDLEVMNDRIWIATSGKGIVEYMLSNEAIRWYESCNGNSLGRVKSMMRDREGNTWLLTGGDLCFSFANKIEFFDHLGNVELSSIHALTLDGEDHLWFANDRGLFRFNPYHDLPEKEPEHFPLAIDLGFQKIMSLYRDPFGFIWIGTFGQGLIRLDPNSGQQRIITETDGLVNGNILSITGDSAGIWFGTLGGASHCFVDDRMNDLRYVPYFENYGQDEGLVNNYIYQVYLAPDGTPYFATDGNGVQVYKDGSFENITGAGKFLKAVVYSVTSDNEGNVWMNMARQGIFKYDGTHLVPISSGTRLERSSFSGMLHNLHELVLAHDQGIDILNLQTGSIRYFGENAGITAINPDLNTLARDSRNNVWIGTAKGIIKYQPQVEALWEHPKTNLTDVALFLDKIDHQSKHTFNHRENHLSFTYSGLWYQNPERVEFLFKLEGHDLDWIRTRNDQVVYSDLKPGSYTFRVKAGIFGNYSPSNEEEYAFRIRKPYYSSLWFYLAALSGFGLLVAWIFSIRVKQVRRKEEIIQEKIRFQFENLKSQINPHFLFNSFSTLIALIEDDPGKAVNYVEELSMLFRNILEYKDHDLVSMEKELEIAGNYINLQKKRFGDSLVVEIAETASFSGTKIPPLTLQLLIENAIKHNVVSREKPLTIKIFSKPGENRIFVENNIRTKMENVPTTGIGINNIINRYKLLTGANVIINRSDSVFSVGLPFIHQGNESNHY